MSAMVEKNDFDVEAQQSLLMTPELVTRTRQTMKRLFLLMHSVVLFKLGISDSSSNPSYSTVGTADDDEEEEDNSVVTSSFDVHKYLEIEEATDFSTCPPGDSFNVVSCVPQNEHISIELRRKKVAEIVEKMNLDELQNIGGVQGVADALNTDLKNGISDDHEAICGSKPNEIRLTSIFFEVFLEKCNNYTFFLLLLAAALSLAFGIKKNGRANGWIDGALLILFIFVLVIFTAISSYLQARKSKKNIQKKWFSEGRNVKVQVIRGGRPPAFILAYDLQVGDIVYLQRGYQVPADGIFIAGEALELYDGLRSPVDDKTPFLFYGSRVINGYARMIVTSG